MQEDVGECEGHVRIRNGMRMSHVVDCLRVMRPARSTPSPDFCCLSEVGGRGDGAPQTVEACPLLSPAQSQAWRGRGEVASEGELDGHPVDW